MLTHPSSVYSKGGRAWYGSQWKRSVLLSREVKGIRLEWSVLLERYHTREERNWGDVTDDGFVKRVGVVTEMLQGDTEIQE